MTNSIDKLAVETTARYHSGSRGSSNILWIEDGIAFDPTGDPTAKENAIQLVQDILGTIAEFKPGDRAMDIERGIVVTIKSVMFLTGLAYFVDFPDGEAIVLPEQLRRLIDKESKLSKVKS